MLLGTPFSHSMFAKTWSLRYRETPRFHLPVEHLLVRLDHILNTFIDGIQVAVGDDHRDFDDDIRLVVQTCVSSASISADWQLQHYLSSEKVALHQQTSFRIATELTSQSI